MSLFSVTVRASQCAVAYRDGALMQVLGTGRHRRLWRARYVRVDLRESLLTLAPQEVLTADGVSVKVSAAARWSVADPQAYVERSTDPVGLVYLGVQVALREALASLTCEQAVQRGQHLTAGSLTEAADAVARGVGVSVTEVVVKDVVLPAAVRAAAVELHTARQRGAAQLEAARAETAALRSLANGARVLDEHPALAQLRLVQSAPEGAQLVFHVGPAQRP
jgi:regulator of protease activity HflC (stomatin/prohibitin superfamily)